MAQQTAVEWLENVYNTQGRILSEQFEQAKQMEKEQIIKARLSLDQSIHFEDALCKAEQYYTETYGK